MVYASMRNCKVAVSKTKDKELKDKAQFFNKKYLNMQILLNTAHKKAICIIVAEAKANNVETGSENVETRNTKTGSYNLGMLSIVKSLWQLCPFLF